jgi:SAM-dependent methyltransferase
MATFEDHFSGQAREYARYRPGYPPELFVWLASIAPSRRLAWDCGTGSGQAAMALASHFDRVVATDASADQIGQAAPHERVDYRVERAEDVSLDPESVDLVTVAVAVHWFDFEVFYAAVRRVARPGGILAVWTYHLLQAGPGLDEIFTHYSNEVLEGFWPEQIRYVMERYKTLPFPFDEIGPPSFAMQTRWTLDQVTGFFESWSATQRYARERGVHPVSLIWKDLCEAWGDPDSRRVITWPLHLRVGRI